MSGRRLSAGIAVLARALVRLVRYLLLLIALLLCADLLAVVLVMPTALLGPFGGIPITVGLLGLAAYAVRRLVAARGGEEQRRRQHEEKLARRRLKYRRWSSKLRWLEGAEPWERIGYREAASELGFYGYAAGLVIYHIVLVVAFHAWPDTMKSSPLLAILGSIVMAGAVGFGAAVLYGVHLHHRVRSYRRRRLRERLESVAMPMGGEMTIELVGDAWDLVDSGASGDAGGDSGD